MYGLTVYDLENINNKIQLQKKYLQDNFFTTSSGQIKTLLDVSFSANHSQRYYAQLTNKINTMTDYSQSFDLVPVFVTITLDGFYRDFLQSDFSRFESFDEAKQKEILKSIPNNEVYGYLHDKIDLKQSFSIKDLYNVLNYQYKKFLSSYVFKKMRKLNKKYMYIRTCEPHKKDGVPHFHIMLYIPKEYNEMVKNSFISHFPAPQNEKEGFIEDINNPAGYILKYITKSFKDVKNQNDLDYIQAWFIKHRIMRCVTSKFTVPQWVYQKCYAIEKDWHYLTDFIYSDSKLCEWSKEDDYFHFIDLDSSREILYDRGQIKLIRNDKEFQVIGEIKENKKVIVSSIPKYRKPKNYKAVAIEIDGEQFTYYNGNVSKYTKKPYEMNMLELYEYFHSLDIETCNLKHYAITKNLMIDKGLLDEPKVDLSHYQDEFFSHLAETTSHDLHLEAEEVF